MKGKKKSIKKSINKSIKKSIKKIKSKIKRRMSKKIKPKIKRKKSKKKQINQTRKKKKKVRVKSGVSLKNLGALAAGSAALFAVGDYIIDDTSKGWEEYGGDTFGRDKYDEMHNPENTESGIAIGDVPLETYDQDGDGLVSEEEYENVNNALIERFEWNCDQGFIPNDICNGLGDNLSPREGVTQEDIDNLWYVEENLSHNPAWMYTGAGAFGDTEEKELIEQHNTEMNQKYGVNVETDVDLIHGGELTGWGGVSPAPPGWAYSQSGDLMTVPYR